MVGSEEGEGASFLALILLFVILILSNMVLYHHLMSYRSPIPTHTDNTQQQYRVVDKSSPPSSHDEWISLVQEQLKSRDQELHHWQDTLYSFVQALDQIEATVRSYYHRLKSIKTRRDKEAQLHKLKTRNHLAISEVAVILTLLWLVSVKGLPLTSQPPPKQEL